MGCFCSKSKFVEEDVPAPRPHSLTPTPVSTLKKPAPDQGKMLESGDQRNLMAPGVGAHKPRDPEEWRPVKACFSDSSDSETRARRVRGVRRYVTYSRVDDEPHTGMGRGVVYSPSIYSQPSNPSQPSLRKEPCRKRKYVLPSDF